MKGSGERLKPLLMSDLVRFLDGVEAKGACARCGQFSWTLFTRNDSPEHGAAAGLVATAPDGAMMIGSYFPFAVYYCNNCGNSYMHHWPVIQRWLEQNPAPSQEGEP